MPPGLGELKGGKREEVFESDGVPGVPNALKDIQVTTIDTYLQDISMFVNSPLDLLAQLGPPCLGDIREVGLAISDLCPAASKALLATSTPT